LTISAAVVVVAAAVAVDDEVDERLWVIDNSVQIIYFVVVPVLGDIHQELVVGMIVVVGSEVVGVGVVVVVGIAGERAAVGLEGFCIVVAEVVVEEGEEAVEVAVVVVANAEQEVPFVLVLVLVLEAKDPYIHH